MVKEQKGQTLIETALILFLLLLILLGISEFARAWYTKNSLKNAARQGARVAVVTSGITADSDTKPASPPANCDGLTGNAQVFCEIWISAPGLPAGTIVNLTINDDDGSGGLNAGDTITVDATSTFTYIVGGSPWPWPDSTDLTTNASMRYE